MARKTTTPKSQSPQPSRRLKTPEYKRFKLNKRIKHPVALPSGWMLFKHAVGHLRQSPKLYTGHALVYFFLTILFVNGLQFNDELNSTKDIITEGLGGFTGNVVASVTVLGMLTSAAGEVDSLSATYSSIIVLITSLAIIWTLRQRYANEQVRVKQSFYKSMYPLIPFILVLCIIALQMIPFIVGAFMYATVVNVGIAVTGAEQILWGLLVLGLAVWSLYMIIVSVFALYITTLPDTTPLQAMHSAKKLLQYRRWTVMRKTLFLPFILLVFLVIVMLPIVTFVTPISQPIYFVITAAMYLVAHSYMYGLYRELLRGN